MKAFFIGLIGMCLFAWPTYGQSRLQVILDTGVLRVGTTGDFNPMSFKDPKTGDYKGYDIDTVKKLAADMEVKLQFVPTDWKTLVNGIVANQYDITTSASVSPARAKVAGYSAPYVIFGTVPMTLKKNLNRFNSWGSINKSNVTVATTLGTVFEAQAKGYFDKAKITAVEAPARDYQEVLAGRADVSITSNIEAASLIKQYDSLRIISVDALRSKRPGAFLLPQNDQVWINFVNHWIRLQHEAGFFEDLQQKWFQ